VVTYDPTNESLNLNVGQMLQYSLLDQQIPIDFDFNLGSIINVSSNTVVAVDATVGFDPGFNFGVFLGSTVPGAQGDLTESVLLKDLNDGDGVTIKTLPAVTAPDDVAAADGQLPADTILSLTINGVARQVTVLKQDTANNRAILDLVKDVSTALANAGLAGSFTAESTGARLIFTQHDSYFLTGGPVSTFAPATDTSFTIAYTSGSSTTTKQVLYLLRLHLLMRALRTWWGFECGLQDQRGRQDLGRGEQRRHHYALVQ